MNTQNIREVISATFFTYIIPAAAPTATEMKMESQGYHELVGQDGPEHKRGPPHLHVFYGMLHGLAQETKLPPENKVKIEAAAETYQKLGMTGAQLLVQYCRLKGTYRKQYKRIVIAMKEDTLLEISKKTIIEAMVRCGFEFKMGIAKEAGFEGAISQAYDKLTTTAP